MMQGEGGRENAYIAAQGLQQLSLSCEMCIGVTLISMLMHSSIAWYSVRYVAYGVGVQD